MPRYEIEQWHTRHFAVDGSMSTLRAEVDGWSDPQVSNQSFMLIVDYAGDMRSRIYEKDIDALIALLKEVKRFAKKRDKDCEVTDAR